MNWIHNTNLLKKVVRVKSTIQILWKKFNKTNPRYKSFRFGFASPPAWIREDSFHAIVLWIRQDLSGFVRIHENRLNLWNSGHKSNPRIRIFNVRTCESGFANLWSRIRQPWNETYLFGVRIPAHDTKQIPGFAKGIHVFTNLLYDSRILIKITWIPGLFPGAGESTAQHSTSGVPWDWEKLRCSPESGIPWTSGLPAVATSSWLPRAAVLWRSCPRGQAPLGLTPAASYQPEICHHSPWNCSWIELSCWGWVPWSDGEIFSRPVRIEIIKILSCGGGDTFRPLLKLLIKLQNLTLPILIRYLLQNH